MMPVLKYLSAAVMAFLVTAWLSDVFGLSLRDPRFFDGWLLLAAMGGQMLFHFRDWIPGLRRGTDASWRQMHIFSGYLVIGIFGIHTSTGLPDSPFEWAIWTAFVVVILSGILGSYLMVVIPLKLEQSSARFELDAIPVLRQRLAQRAEALVTSTDQNESLQAIWTLYANTLRDFFNGPRNFLSHMQGSKLPLRRLHHAIDASAFEVADADKRTLQAFKALVAEKDLLDFSFAQQAVLKSWTFVHVPATYGLLVLTLVHVAIVYAFSSGVP